MFSNIILVFCVLLIYFYILSSSKKRKCGYLFGHKYFDNQVITNSKSESNIEFSFHIKKMDKEADIYSKFLGLETFSSIPNDSLISLAKNKDVVVGGLICFNWETRNQKVYIANYLYVMEDVRHQGIANKLIKNIGEFLVNKGNIGIFSTHHNLSLMNKLYEIYWYKFPITGIVDKKSKPVTKISSNQLVFNNYPSHPWLDTDKSKIESLLRFQEDNGLLIYEMNDNICACSVVNDKSNQTVIHMKWYWGKLDSKFIRSIIENLNNKVSNIIITHYVLPFCIKKRSEQLWDLTNYYYYGNIDDQQIPYFSDRDKLGWYLDR